LAGEQDSSEDVVFVLAAVQRDASLTCELLELGLTHLQQFVSLHSEELVRLAGASQPSPIRTLLILQVIIVTADAGELGSLGLDLTEELAWVLDLA